VTSLTLPTILSDDDVAEHLSMAAATVAVEEGLRLLARGEAFNARRLRQDLGGVETTTMWASAPGHGDLGVKIYPIVTRGSTVGADFLYALHDTTTGRFTTVMQADLLGRLRTGAMTAVAAKCLAVPGAKTAAIIGTGGQAPFQVDALSSVLALERLLVVGRSQRASEQFARRLTATGPFSVTAADGETAVREADVIVTITSSPAPVLPSARFRPGVLVIAAGSNVADRRELGADTIAQFDRIVVDLREVARGESGDLLANGYDPDLAVELGRVLEGAEHGRTSDDERILFESHGLAITDLMCARLVASRAREVTL
jgi:ornithine cyclodeaminase/alanine dehydrogenase-like protein (mu-crystallin family)